MIKSLIAAALSAASVPAAPARATPIADADPAIWVVNDHDTVIYLFGTFHALDGRSEWFNDEVWTAFAASDELVLETIVPEGIHTEPRSTPTPHRVPPIAPSASFLASTRMAISAGRSRGMKADNGADMVLRRAAEAAGKRIEGLESFSSQLSMFSRMPEQPAPAAGPAQGARAMDDLSIVMGEMQSAWNRGESGIFSMMLSHMAVNSPQTYNVMFTQRNTHWAGWIARRLQKPGTVFVAVGAGHLAGRDSVQAKLAELGVRSARIN